MRAGRRSSLVLCTASCTAPDCWPAPLPCPTGTKPQLSVSTSLLLHEDTQALCHSKFSRLHSSSEEASVPPCCLRNLQRHFWLCERPAEKVIPSGLSVATGQEQQKCGSLVPQKYRNLVPGPFFLHIEPTCNILCARCKRSSLKFDTPTAWARPACLTFARPSTKASFASDWIAKPGQ